MNCHSQSEDQKGSHTTCRSWERSFQNADKNQYLKPFFQRHVWCPWSHGREVGRFAAPFLTRYESTTKHSLLLFSQWHLAPLLVNVSVL